MPPTCAPHGARASRIERTLAAGAHLDTCPHHETPQAYMKSVHVWSSLAPLHVVSVRGAGWQGCPRSRARCSRDSYAGRDLQQSLAEDDVPVPEVPVAIRAVHAILVALLDIGQLLHVD